MVSNYDYSLLREKIKHSGLSMGDFAQLLSIDRSTLYRKLKNKCLFSQREMEDICDVLNIPYEDVERYFFAKKVAK